MNWWTEFKLWVAYKLGVKTLLARPDVVLTMLMKRYDNRILMSYGMVISQYMTRKVGAERWEKVMKVLVLRLDHFRKGIKYMDK